MTLKVWAAIRYEAIKLWAKKLPIYKKPPCPAHICDNRDGPPARSRRVITASC